MDRRRDPRSIVTPYAFAVHPDLLGLPLATPWQRLGAILIDLVISAFISHFVGFGPLALALGVLALWLALRKSGRETLGKLSRIFLGCLGAIVLLGVVVVFLAIRYGPQVERYLEEAAASIEPSMETTSAPIDSAGSGAAPSPEASQPSLGTLLRAGQGAFAFRNAASREEAQAVADRLARDALELDMSRSDIRESLAGLIPDDAPWASDAGEIIDEALQGLSTTAPSLAAGQTADTTLEAAKSLSQEALDSIEGLNQALLAAEEEAADYRAALGRTSKELEEAQNGGLFDWIYGLVDDLGLGFGWWALYVTITHAWWKGTSVGKKVFKIRVVMIDKRPLNWWLSFERAGGYAAGFATGLLGFAQVFWDPNRQAIHDKVSETIVIQDGKAPVPGPWIEEGRAQWSRGRPGATGTTWAR